MESDVISRHEAIDRFNLIRPVDPRRSEYTHGIDVGIAMCIVAVKDQSSEPYEIIRCKDCIHIRKWRSEESAKKFGQIYECTYGVLMRPFPDDFCSKAERKRDGRPNKSQDNN